MAIAKEKLRRLAERAGSGRVVAFDTETTGCSRYDEICQIAAVEYVNGEQGRKFCAYVMPTCEMSPGAEAVHGISMSYLRKHGIDPEDAMTAFFDFIGDDPLLVAHNIKFDLRMLKQECDKFELDCPVDGLDTCDTLALSRALRPELPKHTLAHMVEALGVDGCNSHDALDDTLACGGVFFALVDGL